MSSLYSLKNYCYSSILVFGISMISSRTHAQSSRHDWWSQLAVNVEYGLSYPTIEGGQSFTILSFPSNPQDEVFSLQSRSFADYISNLGYLGLELQYPLNPKLSLGIGLQYRDSYNYSSVMSFAEEKHVLSNNLLIATTGLFSHYSKISTTSLFALSKFELFQFDMNYRSQVSFQISAGAGLSFMTLRSQLNNVFLTMQVTNSNNNNNSQNNILGPGNIAPETNRNLPFAWHIGAGFLFKFENFTNIEIGYKIIHIGHFIIMERSPNMKDLFILRSTNTNAQDQNLILSTTNQKRRMFSNDFYIKFYF